MLFTVGLLLMAMIPVAHGKTLTFSDTIPPRTIDWEDTLTFSKFPPGIGALTGIDIAINASIDGSLAVENLHDTASTISSTTDVDIQLTRPDGSELATSIATQTNADAFPVFDGSPDLQGASAKTYPLSAQKNEIISLTDLSETDLNLFTGVDTIQLPVLAKGTTGFVSVGHVLTEINIASSATITVTYTYGEPDVAIQVVPQGALRIGQDMSYILLVQNVGTDPSVGLITVTDTYPNSFSLKNIGGADWTCTENNGVNTCTHPGPLQPGTTLPILSVTLHIGSSSPPTLSKTSSVTIRGDINTNNNTVTTGLLIAGTASDNAYQPPDYHFSNTPPAAPSGHLPPTNSGTSTPSPPPSTEKPFSFGQEHGAFGGPTKPSTGSVLIFDAEGCPISQEFLSPHPPTKSCSLFDPEKLSSGSFSREEIIHTALLAHCIAIKGTTIQTAKERTLITGDPRPEDPATNAETLAVLLRASHALPRGYQLQTALHWYAPYLHFARLHHIIPLNFDPHGLPTRDTLITLIKNTQFLNPNPNVHRSSFVPIRLVGDFEPIEGTTCKERDPHVVSCLAYDPWREISFSDIRSTDPVFDAIDLLRLTRIAPQGDYIFSGHGNHSTGIQQTHFQKGSFEFQPLRPATRLEIVKIALISNCIPILDYIPLGTPTFTDIHKGFLRDEIHDFTARVFYTAALHGIIKGYPDGSARPHAPADHLEAMAILLRAAGAIPNEYAPQSFHIPELHTDGWYAPYVSFASEHQFIPLSPLNSPIARSTLSILLTKTMEYSEDIRVRAYMSSIHPLLQ
ncbi:choice-of-anchor E domain-containing protein [Candidatus Peregrinibacteria bacterium]|nr:choice-of-anchor E domain-containing protein [Candidatus Peregrinibacteria bacterium]